MTSLLAANGEPVDRATSADVDTFYRPDGALTSALTRRRGGRWYDANESRPTQFDPFEIDDHSLVAPGTTRDTYGPTIPELAAGYPTDPETGDPYSPWIVTHRTIWQDIGQDDDFQIDMAWSFSVDIGCVVQLSPAVAIDLTAAGDETGLLPIYDVSLFGGVTYWQVVPLTQNVADTFDPSVYYSVPGTAVLLTMPTPGVHWWRIRAEGGQLTSYFDGVEQSSIARPAWSVGRTTVGAHVVGIHCDPDEVYPPGLPAPIDYRIGTPGEDPPPVATCPRWQVTTW